jgi:hypothetical protein
MMKNLEGNKKESELTYLSGLDGDGMRDLLQVPNGSVIKHGGEKGWFGCR